jgi:alkylation response protein AidB-like acyl-CoA dehydrogenase
MATPGLEPENLEMVLQTLRDYFERNLPFAKRTEWDHEDRCPEKEIRAMMDAETGLHLIYIPEEYGGLGASPHDIYRFCEEIGRLDLGIATAVLAVSLGTEPIVVGGTAEQKARWIGRVAEEGLLVAYAVTEPEAGSNVEALKTRAEPVTGPDGKTTAYRITGVKQFISNGGIADLYTVLAKAPGGPSFFVVERKTDGVGVGKKEEKHGIRLSDTAQVILENVEVPAENLLGNEEGRGIDQANKVFGYTRLMVAALGLGGAGAAVRRAVDYAMQRKQFGTLLSEKQGYMHKLIVPYAVRIEAARAYIEEVARALGEGSKDLHVEGSIAKLFATETGNAAADAAIQALGGYGYCREYEVEKIKRDVRVLTIYEGTSEIQQNIIGLFRLRAHVRSRGALYEDQAKETEALGEQVGGPHAAAALRLVGKSILQAFRSKISKQQHVLFEIADSVVDAEVAAALCRKAAKGPEALKAAARVWASEAVSLGSRRLPRLFEEENAELRAIIEGKADGYPGRLADLDAVARGLAQPV